ncbi:MAG: hypothetical protein SFT92_09990 [Rickettsiales bacterium]|nr:hypothetical protein [Rickettsiales bacterium]
MTMFEAKSKTIPFKQSTQAFSASSELSEFIPYYCHYSPTTLLTKNGELMQIIKISSNAHGLNYESGDGSGNSVRETIRRAIREVVTDERYSVWVHTMRKRNPVQFEAGTKEPFASYVYEKWEQQNGFKFSYYNEIYITILHEGQSSQMIDKGAMKHLVFPQRNRAWRQFFLDTAYVELDDIVSGIIQRIAPHYNARRLSIVERLSPTEAGHTLFYSEPMECLGTMINLVETPFPVPQRDLSDALLTHKLTFGYNAIESRDDQKGRRFGAILTLKQYLEMPSSAVDRILQSPIELIITEIFHFVSQEDALDEYKQQKELFDFSNDLYSVEVTGLADILESDQKGPTDFVRHQVSIMIMVDEYKKLDNEVTNAHEAFSGLGLITVREDIKLEECYWTQLPGNFEFIRRGSSIATSKIAGFTRLNLFTSGVAHNNHWGEALTIMPTTVNSPYFFNFHYQDNGHTLIFDFNSFHDQVSDVLLNFFACVTRKYQPKLYVFDNRRAAHLTLNKLAGQYHTLPIATDQRACEVIGLNPFSLEDSPRNRGFLMAWCSTLVAHRLTIDDSNKFHLQQAIDQLYSAAPEQRNLNGLVAILANAAPDLAHAFDEFHGHGAFAGIFDAPSDTINFSDGIHGFDLDAAVARLPNIVPLFSYMLHRIVLHMDGKPAIIVLNEAWRFLENSFFAPRLESLLDMLKQNNVMVIFTTQSPRDVLPSYTLTTLMNSCTTKLYIPDDIWQEYQSDVLGLSAHDEQMLQKMDRQKCEFLIKQKDETTALRTHIRHMDDVHAIFSNDIKTLISAGGPFASLPKGY